ncbi:MAG: DUF2269 family protein [Chloroflexi bacterium]|nr:DUF2269 family protein [Chloroflexota bacterium]
MPHGWEVAIFVHILGVFAMAGGATMFMVLFGMMRRAANVQEVRVLASVSTVIDKVFPVAAVVLLLSGGYIVSDRDLHWSSGWINVSALALIIMTAIGAVVNHPKTNAVRAAAEAAPDGPVPENLSALIEDPVLFGAVHVVMLVVVAILWNMTTKPGGIQAFLVIAILAAVGAASAYPRYQRQREQARR